MALPDEARDVLDFWFGTPGSAEHGRPRPEWFRKDPAFDALIARAFGATIEAALAGRRDDWADEGAAGALALIVLLDQFTRNVFRGTPRAFAGDAAARALAQRLLDRGEDKQLPPLQRSFAYLPFEHAEDAALQARSVQLFEALAAADPGQAEALDYARRHRDVIFRFGRFPHRNAVLGRADTAEEAAFLQQPGSRF